MIKIIPTGPFFENSLIVSLSGNFENGSDVFAVDPASCDFSSDKKQISSFLQEHQLNLVAVVLTHGHFDHVAGLPFLKELYPSVPVLIHKEDSAFIGAQSQVAQKEILNLMDFEEFLPYVSNLPNADYFLEDSKTLFSYVKVSGMENWQIIHSPGHTKGSCCFYNESEKILIAGDTIFYHSWGRCDLPGGSEFEIQQSLKNIYKKVPKDTLVFSGHNECGYFLGENF